MVTTARRAFLKRLDVPAVEAALRQVETRTSGALRISIAGYFRGDAERLAARAFHRLGLDTTRDRNGVLIFIAPARRRVFVLGDTGIHARLGDAFWQEVAAQLTTGMRSGHVHPAVLQAIGMLGDELARHFPA